MARRSAQPEEPDDQTSEPTKLPERASALICETVQRFLDNPEVAGRVARNFERRVPAEIRECVDQVLESYLGAGKSYRIALICQLAVGIESTDPVDITKRAPGMRGQTGTAGVVGKFLKDRHISSVADAYQNIGKNVSDLIRGNVPSFDSALRWAAQSGRKKEDLKAVLEYCCCEIAKTARPVLPMPALNAAKLTFASLMLLLDALLEIPSSGAYHQFITAALLAAREEQLGSGRRIETKHIHSSDESAAAPADIQVKFGTKVEEAFEVTANEWFEKVHAVGQTIRAYDLSRLHIVASVQDHAAMLAQLAALPDDVSVLELRGYIAALASELRRAGRAAALGRLYELLDRYQSNVELVNEYVRALHSRKLTAIESDGK